MISDTINVSTLNFARHDGEIRDEECLRGTGISERKIKVVAEFGIVFALPILTQRGLSSLSQCTA